MKKIHDAFCFVFQAAARFAPLFFGLSGCFLRLLRRFNAALSRPLLALCPSKMKSLVFLVPNRLRPLGRFAAASAERPSNLRMRPCMDCFEGSEAVVDPAFFRFKCRRVSEGLRLNFLARTTLSLRGSRGGKLFSLNKRAASTAFSF